MADFNALLESKVEDAKAPVPKPPGTYRLRVTKLPEKKTSANGFEGLEFTFVTVSALDDVDPDLLEGINLSKGNLRDTFWFTDEAIYRLREFLEKAGFDIENRSFKECIAEVVNVEINAFLTQTPGTGKNEGRVFTNIDSYLAISDED